MVTDVIEGCTVTDIGPLVTLCAVAVMVAVPEMGLLEASTPLQTTNVASHTPPHTSPLGETVATLVLEELKVKTVGIVALAELTALVESASTCPATREAEAGDTRTCATVVFAAGLLLPQPARKAAINGNKASMFPDNKI